MSKRLARSIKISAAICLALSSLAVIRLSENTTPAAGLSSVQAGQDNQPFDQAQALSDLKKKIAGQENKPAEEVFKNIQLLKGVPAARLLKVMEVGYSKSLGISCTHCHLIGQWEKDDKPTKQITREMIVMVRAINNDYLKKIKGLKSESPVVNCTTCHRGQIKPELNLPDAKPKS